VQWELRGAVARRDQSHALGFFLGAHTSTRFKTVAWSTAAGAVSIDPPDGTARHVRMTSGVSLSSVPVTPSQNPSPYNGFWAENGLNLRASTRERSSRS
jgi:hypothetical protein